MFLQKCCLRNVILRDVSWFPTSRFASNAHFQMTDTHVTTPLFYLNAVHQDISIFKVLTSDPMSEVYGASPSYRSQTSFSKKKALIVTARLSR